MTEKFDVHQAVTDSIVRAIEAGLIFQKALQHLAVVDIDRGDYPMAQQQLETSLALARRLAGR